MVIPMDDSLAANNSFLSSDPLVLVSVDINRFIGRYTSLMRIAAVALISVSTVLMRAAVSAAMIKPNTPGLATIFATTTKIWSGDVLGATTEGAVTEIAFPIQPAFPTTIAERGNTKRIFTAAAFLPSFTFLHAMNLMINPWFINKNPMDPAIASCQKIPTKLKLGGWLKSARGSFHSTGNSPQNISNPPRYDIPKKNNIKPANSSINPCNKSVKITAV